MLTFNVICRIAADKRFFEPVFHCISKMKNSLDHNVRLNMIGEVQDDKYFNQLTILAQELGITENIFFTKKSIRYENMDNAVKEGYFLNTSVGYFVGYSTIEAITIGLKTIVFNVDSNFSETSIKDISYCDNAEKLYDLAIRIYSNKNETDRQIIAENTYKQKSYLLNEKETKFLINLL